MQKYFERTDLYFEKKNEKFNKKLNVYRESENGHSYSTLYFKNLHDKDNIKNLLKEEINSFLEKLDLSTKYHVLVVGLGSENYTADSVGPNSLKYITANYYLENLGVNLDRKVSLLEPGVLGETGIETRRIIESVVEEIKPDVVILIDSFVTNNIDNLNHTIEITDEGIVPGSGVKGLNEKIDSLALGVPVVVIGVATAVEVKLSSKNKKDKTNYLLSTNDVDDYVLRISKLIGTCINEIMY